MNKSLSDKELEQVAAGLTNEEAQNFNVDLDKLAGDPIEPEDFAGRQFTFKRLRKNLKTG
jgi:hypothetical protein